MAAQERTRPKAWRWPALIPITTLAAAALIALFIGGGVVITNAMNEARIAKQQIAALQSQIDEANAREARLNAELTQLQVQLAEQQAKLESINSSMVPASSRPRAPSGGGTPVKAVRVGGGAAAKHCNCTPGDPLCLCLGGQVPDAVIP